MQGRGLVKEHTEKEGEKEDCDLVKLQVQGKRDDSSCVCLVRFLGQRLSVRTAVLEGHH